jgi:cilia- and flagella-associated protein 57
VKIRKAIVKIHIVNYKYFASVYGSAIGIHSTWSFETIGHLKGHSGKVRSICWSLDDNRIVSCGLDGNVYDWNVSTLKRDSEQSWNNVLMSSACFSPDSKFVYAVGSDGLLKVGDNVMNEYIF